MTATGEVSPPAADAPWHTWVAWAVSTFADRLRVACSLSAEDSLLVQAVAEQVANVGCAPPTVFVLDTGRLHEESYHQLERLRLRYRLPFVSYVPDAIPLESLLRRKGPLSFFASPEDRRECCEVRKVEPLRRALTGASAWMTGQRRAQSPTRAVLTPLETDDRGMVKLNPLTFVDDATLWHEVETRGVPVHALHKAGYPSIGCAPCTRAVAAGDDPRSGRWWWESPETKECGLHRRAQGEKP